MFSEYAIPFRSLVAIHTVHTHVFYSGCVVSKLLLLHPPSLKSTCAVSIKHNQMNVDTFSSRILAVQHTFLDMGTDLIVLSL